MLSLSCQPLSSRERARSGRGATRHRRKIQRQRRAAAILKGCQLEAKISQATIDRLLPEAEADPRFEGMAAAEISACLLPRIEAYRKTLPWWFGQFDKPRSKGNHQQPEGLKLYHKRQRQEKAERERRLNERLANPTS